MTAIRKFIERIVKMIFTPDGYTVDVCLIKQRGTWESRWFSVKFSNRKAAKQWMQKVIERFENHPAYPLNMVLLVAVYTKCQLNKVLDDHYCVVPDC